MPSRRAIRDSLSGTQLPRRLFDLVVADDGKITIELKSGKTTISAQWLDIINQVECARKSI